MTLSYNREFLQYLSDTVNAKVMWSSWKT